MSGEIASEEDCFDLGASMAQEAERVVENAECAAQFDVADPHLRESLIWHIAKALRKARMLHAQDVP